MKKRFILLAVILAGAGAVYAQAQIANPVPQMDEAVKYIAGEISRKLRNEKATKVAVDQFIYRNAITALGSYWTNQLVEELANAQGKEFVVIQERGGSTEWIISGEITELGAVTRIYSRLIRQSDRSIALVLHSDMERNPYLTDMLSDGGSSSSSSSRMARDGWEPDSMESAVTIEPGDSESAPVMNRSIHAEGDEDFFLITAGSNGRLVAETTGNMDTYMRLYDAASHNELDSDDDDGSDTNARIRHNVEAGKSYIAKVYGYSGSAMGRYGFRAYIYEEISLTPDEYESDNDSSSAKTMEPGTSQRHTFHNDDDVDWIKFEITQSGRYTIRARGVISNGLDTYIELFSDGEELGSLDEDDDGGEHYDSRLSISLEPGIYYLKVSCLDDEPEEPAYTVSIQQE